MITFTPEYMDTLSTGSHTIGVQLNDDRTANLTVTVEKEETPAEESSKQEESSENEESSAPAEESSKQEESSKAEESSQAGTVPTSDATGVGADVYALAGTALMSVIGSITCAVTAKKKKD